MRIRPETPEEFPLLYDFVRRAFATARVCDGDEQDYAARLRDGDAYIPALALVAEEGGRIIGHVLFTRLAVRRADGGEQPALLLGPLSVALEHRQRGVGAALVREGCRRAMALGHSAVFLVGDPAYYGRFGFRPAADFGIANTNELPDSDVLARELTPGALAGLAGGTITLEGF